MSVSPDQTARDRALNIQASFIVQAPAGSGKTALLTQRILALLAVVDSPEQILAITFTRKAAAEMHHRLLKALADAVIEKDRTPYEITTATLAKAALARSEARGWHLMENPHRLRILTIDAFCMMIVKQMPILSGLGCGADIAQDPDALYEQAARDFLKGLETPSAWQPALATLLLHLDNQHDRLKAMFIDMLQHREQWLSPLLQAKSIKNLRALLESALQHVITTSIQACQAALPPGFTSTLQPLLVFALNNLPEDSPLQQLASFDGTTASREGWLALSDFLLTQTDTWRKRVDKSIGFLAQTEASSREEKTLFQSMKASMQLLLESLSSESELLTALTRLRLTPTAHYTDDQWNVIEALMICLPRLAAQLQLLFTETNNVDFIQVSTAARHALGDDENPAELALKLDYQIHHILVDEFQDTSISQFQLLERLTAGWMPGDGKTLFCVGDPMQSIYRFRQAEVGLFLQAQATGIGHLPLTPLFLTANFRSHPPVVAWINHYFDRIMPTESNPHHGAVPFNQAIAVRSEETGGVECHATDNAALCICQLVSDTQSTHPDASMAILVRSRGHLIEIIPQLRARGLAFQAVELESLALQPVIQDLLSLVQALDHLGDRTAWLSVLRAPWCGLSLADLLVIAESDPDALIRDRLRDLDINTLSHDGQRQLQRITPLLLEAAEQQHRHADPAHFIQTVWRKLGGPASYQSDTTLADADAFFALMRQLTVAGHVCPAQLSTRLAALFAESPQHAPLHIMTIHKAKGLEFDFVFLPGLEKRPRNSQAPLLRWMLRPAYEHGIDFLLGPITATHESTDPISHYLASIETSQSRFESIRLLYVAITRAKQQCHVIYETEETDEGLKAPSSSSLLAALWPHLPPQSLQLSATPSSQFDDLYHKQFSRLPLTWESPVTLTFPTQHNVIDPNASQPPSQTQILIGVLCHRLLKAIADSPNAILNADTWLNADYQPALLHLGVPHTDLLDAVEQVQTALHHIFNDEKAAFILSPHPSAASELALSEKQGDKITHWIIDRTFIYNQTRYIIDYKCVQHAEQNRTAFLSKQRAQYATQLSHYARLFKHEGLPIKLGLYFPMQGWLDEWNDAAALQRFEDFV